MPAKIGKMTPYKSGRPPQVKTLIERNFKEILAAKMGTHFPDVIDAMISTAKGYETTTIAPDGTILQKKDKPDVQAGKLLFEYTLDKPKQEIAHSGTMGIVHLVASLEQDDDND
jgi:hypothetical protein